MVVTNSEVHALDIEQRNRLEHLLVEFERSWHANRLAECAAELPSDGTLRTAALVELVKIDLERRWQSGQSPTAEEYAARFPELLTAEGVPFDLIQAELEAQRRAGTADMESFCRRFPGHSEALRELLSRTVQSNPVPPAQAELGTSDGSPSTVRSAPRGEPTGLPERFGRYLIRRRLGQGGMGAVFLAHDTELGRDVAVKVPQLAGGDAPDTLERFYREARAAAALRHPHLCPVYDVGQIDGTHFLTMAYVEGRTLADDIKTGPRPPAEAAALVRLLALALEFAHRHGVVHRDLKPANVLLNAAGEPAITDFGLARRVNQEDEPLTKAGAILGTPAYMSPEQVQGRNEDVGPTSDVYSLGVILYELLTGQRPFRGTMTSIMIQIATEEPESPSRLQQDLCPQLEEIVMRAMKKKIGDRYPSMGEFAAALDRFLQGNVPAPAVSPSRPPAKKRWLVAAAGLFAAVLLAGVIVIVIKDKDGKVVGVVQVPEGGSFEGKQVPDKEGEKPVVPPVVPMQDPKRANEPKQNSKDLFNGKDLAGWEGLDKVWQVKDGAIFASTFPDGRKQNTFLCSKEKFKDFELEFDARVLGKNNSGVMIRSQLSNRTNYWLNGIKCDLGSRRAWGDLVTYDGENGSVIRAAEKTAAQLDIKAEDFNHVVIRCVGQKVVVTINGVKVNDTEIAKVSEEGVIGFQLRYGVPTEVAFKNIRIRDLSATAILPVQPTADPATGDKPLAVGKHTTGVSVEVVDIKRTAEDLMQVSWRYRNATDKPIQVYEERILGRDFGPGGSITAKGRCACYMLDALFVTYSSDGKVVKSSIVKDSGGKLFCSKMEELTVKPKATSETFYARFGLPPKDVRKASIVFKDVAEPIELTIPDFTTAPEAVPDAGKKGEPLATGKHKRNVIVEVVEIKRTTEDLMQVSWRYRNESDRGIQVYEERKLGRDFGPGSSISTKGPCACYMLDALSISYSNAGKPWKAKVVKDSGGKLWCSEIAELTVGAKSASPVYFARFSLPPKDVRKVSLTFSDVAEPIELTLPNLAK